MSGGRRYCDVVSILSRACVAVCIGQVFEVVAKQSEKNAIEMFAKEDTTHSKAAEKMKPLMCSRDPL